MLGDERGYLSHMIVATHQAGPLDRQVVTYRVKGTQRRKRSIPDLEQPFDGRQILQPVLAQINQVRDIEQPSRHCRHEHLPTVATDIIRAGARFNAGPK